jgi:hypothetical protein
VTAAPGPAAAAAPADAESDGPVHPQGVRRLAIRRLGAAFCVGALTCTALAAAPAVERTGRVAAAALSEISGCVASQAYEGVVWVHNDSGDAARLFAIDGAGNPIVPPYLRDRYDSGDGRSGKPAWPGLTITNAVNQDWEDITRSGDRLVIADLGNNGNARRDLGLVVLAEPNPRATAATRAEAFLPLRYPEQTTYPARLWHFDSEALFHDPAADATFAITKHRVAGRVATLTGGAHLYRLPATAADGDAMVRVASRDDLGAVTGADLSPDGAWLAVVGYRSLWFFPRPAAGAHWFAAEPLRIGLNPLQTKQLEAGCWVGPRLLLLINESGELFHVDTRTLLDEP